MYRPNSLWTWSFTLIVVVQAIIVLALESYIFGIFESSVTADMKANPAVNVYTKTIPTFLTLYIFGFLYQLVLVWDALRLKNTIQVIGLCIYNLGLFIYAVVQSDQIKQATSVLNLGAVNSKLWSQLNPALAAIPCILAAGTIFMSFVAWKLYDEFSWDIYKHISADLQIRRRYLTFQVYIALLKFDFFLFLGFTIQFAVIVVQTPTDPEFGLTIAAIPVTIVVLLLAAYWTRRESRAGMAVVLFLYFAALAYFFFKLVRMYVGPKVDFFTPVRKTLTIFAVITVILICLTIANAILCMLNFGKGLKPLIKTRKLEGDDEKGYATEMPNLAHAAPPSRMTID